MSKSKNTKKTVETVDNSKNDSTIGRDNNKVLATVSSKEKTMKQTTKKIDTTKLASRKDYYSINDVMQINSTVHCAKGSNLPYLNNKQVWLYTRLAKNDIEQNYTYSLESLSNEYRNEIKSNKEKNAKVKNYTFRKSFKSNEVFSIGDLKSVIQYLYFANARLFEYYRNDKMHYLIKEVEYKKSLSTLK